MTPKQALAFVRKHGVVLESAHGPVPSLAETVAGGKIRGGWWAHPKGNEIFLLTRAIRKSRDVLVCRLVEGKVTYVHRRVWPALAALAEKFPKQRLAALKEVHTAAGKHKLRITPFPKWAPKETLRAARNLSQRRAARLLGRIGFQPVSADEHPARRKH